MKRYLIAAVALMTATVAIPQALTLTNLKGPIAQICQQRPAASIAALWKQINGCQPVVVPTPVPTPSPPPSATPVPTPSPTRTPAPVSTLPPASPITAADRAALIVTAPVPPSAAPDNVGAFRMICSPGHFNWDDAIVYPGQIGGSPHLHQYAGNTTTNAFSTSDILRVSGDSTCSNKLNRSAYWVPALLAGDGRAVSMDFMALYYKRLPNGPSCFTLATKGCVAIPEGLRVLAGYDMKRMGEAQPENTKFSFRCVEPGKPSEHRKLITEAVADCGGAGRVWAQIDFGNCWNGELDSPDHRKHLAFGGYGNWGYYRCPTSHPYAIPQLAEIVQYTISKDDGDIRFSCDRMPGMVAMKPGECFHADYIEAWDRPTLNIWTANCLDRLLNCSDGVLGDGTALKRGPQPYKAEPRLVPVPARPI